MKSLELLSQIEDNIATSLHIAEEFAERFPDQIGYAGDLDGRHIDLDPDTGSELEISYDKENNPYRIELNFVVSDPDSFNIKERQRIILKDKVLRVMRFMPKGGTVPLLAFHVELADPSAHTKQQISKAYAYSSILKNIIESKI